MMKSSQDAFEKFMGFCSVSLKGENPIFLESIKARYEGCDEDFRNSDRIVRLLETTQQNMSSEESRKFVHLRGLLTELKANAAVRRKKHPKKRKMSSDSDSESQNEANGPGLKSCKIVLEKFPSQDLLEQDSSSLDVFDRSKRRSCTVYDGNLDSACNIAVAREDQVESLRAELGASLECCSLSHMSPVQNYESPTSRESPSKYVSLLHQGDIHQSNSSIHTSSSSIGSIKGKSPRKSVAIVGVDDLAEDCYIRSGSLSSSISSKPSVCTHLFHDSVQPLDSSAVGDNVMEHKASNNESTGKKNLVSRMESPRKKSTFIVDVELSDPSDVLIIQPSPARKNLVAHFSGSEDSHNAISGPDYVINSIDKSTKSVIKASEEVSHIQLESISSIQCVGSDGSYPLLPKKSEEDASESSSTKCSVSDAVSAKPSFLEHLGAPTTDSSQPVCSPVSNAASSENEKIIEAQGHTSSVGSDSMAVNLEEVKDLDGVCEVLAGSQSQDTQKAETKTDANISKEAKRAALLSISVIAESAGCSLSSDVKSLVRGNLFKAAQKPESFTTDLNPGPSIPDEVAPEAGASADEFQENKELLDSERLKRRRIIKLERLLGSIRDEIEKCQNTELTLDDLDSESAAYIYEDKLKRKFVAVWNKLCEVAGRTVTTGRPTEKSVKYSGTRYKEINRRIEKFLNRKKVFPDFHDIKSIVKLANKKCGLNMSSMMINDISREAFVDVGEMLQTRRHQDFIATFGTRQTDVLRTNADPYLTDPELRRRLDSNRHVARFNLDNVIAKYTRLQYDRNDEDDEKEDVDDKDDAEKKKQVRKNSVDDKETGQSVAVAEDDWVTTDSIEVDMAEENDDYGSIIIPDTPQTPGTSHNPTFTSWQQNVYPLTPERARPSMKEAVNDTPSLAEGLNALTNPCLPGAKEMPGLVISVEENPSNVIVIDESPAKSQTEHLTASSLRISNTFHLLDAQEVHMNKEISKLNSQKANDSMKFMTCGRRKGPNIKYTARKPMSNEVVDTEQRSSPPDIFNFSGSGQTFSCTAAASKVSKEQQNHSEEGQSGELISEQDSVENVADDDDDDDEIIIISKTGDIRPDSATSRNASPVSVLSLSSDGPDLLSDENEESYQRQEDVSVAHKNQAISSLRATENNADSQTISWKCFASGIPTVSKPGGKNGQVSPVVAEEKINSTWKEDGHAGKAGHKPKSHQRDTVSTTQSKPANKEQGKSAVEKENLISDEIILTSDAELDVTESSAELNVMGTSADLLEAELNVTKTTGKPEEAGSVDAAYSETASESVVMVKDDGEFERGENNLQSAVDLTGCAVQYQDVIKKSAVSKMSSCETLAQPVQRAADINQDISVNLDNHDASVCIRTNTARIERAPLLQMKETDSVKARRTQSSIAGKALPDKSGQAAGNCRLQTASVGEMKLGNGLEIPSENTSKLSRSAGNKPDGAGEGPSDKISNLAGFTNMDLNEICSNTTAVLRATESSAVESEIHQIMTESECENRTSGNRKVTVSSKNTITSEPRFVIEKDQPTTASGASSQPLQDEAMDEVVILSEDTASEGSSVQTGTLSYELPAYSEHRSCIEKPGSCSGARMRISKDSESCSSHASFRQRILVEKDQPHKEDADILLDDELHDDEQSTLFPKQSLSTSKDSLKSDDAAGGSHRKTGLESSSEFRDLLLNILGDGASSESFKGDEHSQVICEDISRTSCKPDSVQGEGSANNSKQMDGGLKERGGREDNTEDLSNQSVEMVVSQNTSRLPRKNSPQNFLRNIAAYSSDQNVQKNIHPKEMGDKAEVLGMHADDRNQLSTQISPEVPTSLVEDKQHLTNVEQNNSSAVVSHFSGGAETMSDDADDVLICCTTGIFNCQQECCKSAAAERVAADSNSYAVNSLLVERAQQVHIEKPELLCGWGDKAGATSSSGHLHSESHSQEEADMVHSSVEITRNKKVHIGASAGDTEETLESPRCEKYKAVLEESSNMNKDYAKSHDITPDKDSDKNLNQGSSKQQDSLSISNGQICENLDNDSENGENADFTKAGINHSEKISQPDHSVSEERETVLEDKTDMGIEDMNAGTLEGFSTDEHRSCLVRSCSYDSIQGENDAADLKNQSCITEGKEKIVEGAVMEVQDNSHMDVVEENEEGHDKNELISGSDSGSIIPNEKVLEDDESGNNKDAFIIAAMNTEQTQLVEDEDEIKIIEELSSVRGVRSSERSKEDDRQLVDQLILEIELNKPSKRMKSSLEGNVIVSPASLISGEGHEVCEGTDAVENSDEEQPSVVETSDCSLITSNPLGHSSVLSLECDEVNTSGEKLSPSTDTQPQPVDPSPVDYQENIKKNLKRLSDEPSADVDVLSQPKKQKFVKPDITDIISSCLSEFPVNVRSKSPSKLSKNNQHGKESTCKRSAVSKSSGQGDDDDVVIVEDTLANSADARHRISSSSLRNRNASSQNRAPSSTSAFGNSVRPTVTGPQQYKKHSVLQTHINSNKSVKTLPFPQSQSQSLANSRSPIASENHPSSARKRLPFVSASIGSRTRILPHEKASVSPSLPRLMPRVPIPSIHPNRTNSFTRSSPKNHSSVPAVSISSNRRSQLSPPDHIVSLPQGRSVRPHASATSVSRNKTVGVQPGSRCSTNRLNSQGRNMQHSGQKSGSGTLALSDNHQGLQGVSVLHGGREREKQQKIVDGMEIVLGDSDEEEFCNITSTGLKILSVSSLSASQGISDSDNNSVPDTFPEGQTGKNSKDVIVIPD